MQMRGAKRHVDIDGQNATVEPGQNSCVHPIPQHGSLLTIAALNSCHAQLDLHDCDHADVQVPRGMQLRPFQHSRVHHAGTLTQLADNIGVEQKTQRSADCGSEVNRAGSNSISLFVCSQSTMLRLSVRAS